MQESLTDIEALPVSAAIVDSSGTIVAVNETWKEFGRRNGLGLDDSGVGSSYLAHCGSDGRDSPITSDLRDLLAGRRVLVTHVYPCDTEGEKRWFSLLAFPLGVAGTGNIAILHTDISGLVPRPIDALMQGQTAVPSQPLRDRELATMSATVEASASKALASQFHAMLSNPADRSEEADIATDVPDEACIRPQLSQRQKDVLRLLGEGKSNKEIADLLYRSPHTIKLHVSAILRQLDVKSRTEAALMASRLLDEP